MPVLQHFCDSFSKNFLLLFLFLTFFFFYTLNHTHSAKIYHRHHLIIFKEFILYQDAISLQDIWESGWLKNHRYFLIAPSGLNPTVQHSTVCSSRVKTIVKFQEHCWLKICQRYLTFPRYLHLYPLQFLFSFPKCSFIPIHWV